MVKSCLYVTITLSLPWTRSSIIAVISLLAISGSLRSLISAKSINYSIVRETVVAAKTTINTIKTTAAQNEVALCYHKVRGLYFLASVFEATI